MAGSSDVSVNAQATAAQYNALRADALACREQFIAAGVKNGTGAAQVYDAFHAPNLTAATEWSSFKNCKAMGGYASIVSAVIAVISPTTHDIDWTVVTEFGTEGEDKDANTASDTANAVTLTANQIEYIDISACFTGMAAEDWVGLQFTRDDANGGSCYVLGAYIKYL